MKCTILIDNRPITPTFETEHGLSILLETEKHSILLDTGASDMLIRNAQRLGKDLSTVDYVSNRIILDRSSYDFGSPKWYLLETLKVPSIYKGYRLVYVYDDGFHDDFNVSEELKIEYYD